MNLSNEPDDHAIGRSRAGLSTKIHALVDGKGRPSEPTHVELAAHLHVTQNRVSRIEHGDIDRAQVDTLRKYVEAVGGRLRVEVELSDERIQIA